MKTAFPLLLKVSVRADSIKDRLESVFAKLTRRNNFLERSVIAMSKIVLGIDVSKKTLDTALIFDNRTFSKQFQNSSEGFKLLAAWLASLHITEVHACLEATGIYGEAVALFLHESGHRVSVVNPLRIKGFAQSNMQRNKTDRLDARLIASFCAGARARSVVAAECGGQTPANIDSENRNARRNATSRRESPGKCRI